MTPDDKIAEYGKFLEHLTKGIVEATLKRRSKGSRQNLAKFSLMPGMVIGENKTKQ